MDYPLEEANFKCATWNARSLPEKINCETLLLQCNLDLPSVTETWLSVKTNNYNIEE